MMMRERRKVVVVVGKEALLRSLVYLVIFEFLATTTNKKASFK
jgi:hypothetical protein